MNRNQPAPEGQIDTTEERSRVRLGMILAGGAAVAYSIGQVLSRKLVTGDVAPQVATFFALLFGTLLILITNGRSARGDLGAPRQAYLMVMLAGICSSTAVMGQFFALKHAPVVIIAPVMAINPLLAMILSAIFLQRLERVTTRMLAGGGLVVAGAVLVAIGATR